MALNKPQLVNDLRALFRQTWDENTSAEDAETAFLNTMANIIDAYVKSATVNYSGGLSTASGGGPVTGILNHTIS